MPPYISYFKVGKLYAWTSQAQTITLASKLYVWGGGGVAWIVKPGSIMMVLAEYDPFPNSISDWCWYKVLTDDGFVGYGTFTKMLWKEVQTP